MSPILWGPADGKHSGTVAEILNAVLLANRCVGVADAAAAAAAAADFGMEAADTEAAEDAEEDAAGDQRKAGADTPVVRPAEQAAAEVPAVAGLAFQLQTDMGD